MEQVKVGVIGAGRMGQRHCRVYSNLRRAALVGIYDTDPLLAGRVSAKYDLPYFEQVDQLLDQVDAVSLATPTAAHFDLAMRCLERGIHPLVEKPVSETLDQAERLLEAAEASGLTFQVGHIERFNPTFQELKNVLDSMSIAAISLRRLSPYQGSNTDVDVIADLMIHDIDLALDLTGKPPLAVQAYGLAALGGRADHVAAHLDYGRAPLVTVTASRITEHKVRSIEVTALEAFLVADLLNKSIQIYRHTIGKYLNRHNQGVKYHQESIVECIHVPSVEPLFLELEHFLESVHAGRPAEVSARDGLEALRLAERIRAACQAYPVAAEPVFPSFAPTRIEPLAGS